MNNGAITTTLDKTSNSHIVDIDLSKNDNSIFRYKSGSPFFQHK